MSTSSVPNEWRTAHVVPIFKSGSSSLVANYRPISLTCIACKLMERIINVNLFGYLHQHKLISKAQHGFLSRRSTNTNLLETLNYWSFTISNRRIASTVYIDFSRAFDSVCHNKLFCKLRSLCIEGNLLAWIISFLSNRTIRTLRFLIAAHFEVALSKVAVLIPCSLYYMLMTSKKCSQTAQLLNCLLTI